jgi:hypothetical protein
MRITEKASVAATAAAAMLLAVPAAHADGVIQVGVPIRVTNNDGLANCGSSLPPSASASR